MRTVSWFSAGAASAVATKLSLQTGPCEIVYTDTGSLLCHAVAGELE